MVFYFILFLILHYYHLFDICFAQPTAVITGGSTSVSMASPTFYLNSSEPSTWYNNDSINMTLTESDGSKIRVVLSTRNSVGFVCGFYCKGSCNAYLFSVVVVGGGDPALVWSANRDHPVPENASLELTKDGDLLLQDSNGTKLWSTNTSGKFVLGMNLTQEGNLLLFNNEGSVVWQSFDHPVDTLLSSQRLYEGQRLIASSSTTNWSRGLYYATITSAAGFAAYTTTSQGQALMYYQLVVSNQSSRTSTGRSNYAELQRGGFLVNLGTSQETFDRFLFSFSFDSFIEYMKLDGDGHLKINQHNAAKGLTELLDMVNQDLGECQHPRSCGPYGVCRQGQCSCPEGIDGVQYFKDTEFQLPNGGCSRITPLSCQPSPDQHHLIEVRNVTYFNVIDPDAASPNIKDIERCKQACLQTCSCGAAIFRYDSNASDGYCYMPAEVLSFREGHIPSYNFTSSTYIKVQIPYEAPTPKEAPTPPSRNQRYLTAIIAGSSASAFIVICAVIVILMMMMQKSNTDTEEGYMNQFPGMTAKFSYEDLRLATEDFKVKLGTGGFGTVFKGTLGDGTNVAVKRLHKMSAGMKDFLAEVESIGSIHHFNLVRLIGFCAEKSVSLLVYEYMSNGSLDNWIYPGGQKPCLGWQTRKKIILDIAKGLAYLHEDCRQRIVHLDIKPQNILLDENFNAKISDFGLSKLINRDESQVLTTMRGTPGYIAPEWRQLRITVKVDIYSFGIVLLEIVSGRKNFDQTRLESSSHLLRLLQEKAKVDRLIDIVENMDEDVHVNREEVVRMIKVGAWCLQDDHRRRPSMSTLVKVLEGVMEVDPNITYRFTYAMASSSVANDHVSAPLQASDSAPPQASVLSNPR